MDKLVPTAPVDPVFLMEQIKDRIAWAHNLSNYWQLLYVQHTSFSWRVANYCNVAAFACREIGYGENRDHFAGLLSVIAGAKTWRRSIEIASNAKITEQALTFVLACHIITSVKVNYEEGRMTL
ncbi:MAG: hypothetical protein IJJ99_01460 [Oscillospiraceae bacterium]|nr:hypothetical protein [Oscillospiraceae bacterium]